MLQQDVLEPPASTQSEPGPSGTPATDLVTTGHRLMFFYIRLWEGYLWLPLFAFYFPIEVYVIYSVHVHNTVAPLCLCIRTY